MISGYMQTAGCCNCHCHCPRICHCCCNHGWDFTVTTTTKWEEQIENLVNQTREVKK